MTILKVHVQRRPIVFEINCTRPIIFHALKKGSKEVFNFCLLLSDVLVDINFVHSSTGSDGPDCGTVG